MKYKIIALFILSLWMVSCGSKQEAPIEAEADSGEFIRLSKSQFETNGYTFDTLQMRPFHRYVEATGMIDVPPQNKAIISTTYGGYVKDTRLLEGDVVNKGQAMISLEGPEFLKLQQEYMEVYNQLDYLKSEFQRQQTLFEEKISSQKQYLKAKSDYETANAKYQGLKSQLQLLKLPLQQIETGTFSPTVTLYAPISGHVSHMNVAKGAYVNPSEVLMEIIDNDHVHLELQVYEKDIMKIKKDQRIRFTIPEASNETFWASVHLVGTTLDPNNRAIKVHGHLEDEENHGLLVGMFVNAQILTESVEAPSLKEDAVVEEEGREVVLQLDHSTDTDYFFVREYPKVAETDGGFVGVDIPISNTPKVYLGKGAFQMLGEGGGE